jgi:metallophosphoesterase superfamily enzyme
VKGRRAVRRCFATDGLRLVLPAFGALAGGLDVLDRAFAPLFAGPFTAHLLGRAAVHAFPSHRLARI